MKNSLLTLLTACLLAATTFAHSDKDLGPHGGRVLEFSTNQMFHGEVTLTNGTFYVAVLDKNMKPVELNDQSLVVTGGDRRNPEKPTIEKKGNRFTFPALNGRRYLLVFQFKDNPSAKPVLARFEYDASICSGCKRGEWLCDCHAPSESKK